MHGIMNSSARLNKKLVINCCSAYMYTTSVPQEWVRVHVHYAMLHAL